MTGAVAARPALVWDQPQFALGDRVRRRSTGELGTVRGYFAWELPIVRVYFLPDDDRLSLGGWCSQSELESQQ